MDRERFLRLPSFEPTDGEREELRRLGTINAVEASREHNWRVMSRRTENQTEVLGLVSGSEDGRGLSPWQLVRRLDGSYCNWCRGD